MAAIWGEWGRYTLSAVAGAAVAVVTLTLWLSDVKHVAADAAAVNAKQDEQLDRLAQITQQLALTNTRLAALQEAQDARLVMLERVR